MEDMFKTSAQTRQEFIRFFEDRGHTFVPSSSLVPAEDPTLLFANAGMNQFKDVFLGTGSRAFNRAANTQKCIRAGGKHNDLEDVGHDTYHHTFFEMLGNWSFGDYFKAEAIQWAWELLTKVWGLPKERLHVTVFGGDPQENLAPDDEAGELWRTRTDIDPTHIHLGSKKDNFWEMGETGPCGPCSEIHIDRTDDLSGAKLVNASDARVIEIWNLVFMQFNRHANGKLTPLPARHVDTGMGFERVCAVLQNVKSNYDTDVFRGLFDAIRQVTSAPVYTGKMEDMKDVAYRVVGDHIRTLTFAITDGAMPSNEGRGYVLRRILRRAARYGRQYLNTAGEEFLYKLVPTIVSQMGESFPELRAKPDRVAQVIREEEASFNKTLDRGIALFEAEAQRMKASGSKVLPGAVAFELYATFGFPVDLTELMARELGLGVDMAGYDSAMAEHKELSSAGSTFKVIHVAGLPATDDSAKYVPGELKAKTLGWAVDGAYITDGGLSSGDEAAIVLGQTNFYAESGGQVGDAGRVVTETGVFAVRDTQRNGDSILHVGVVESGTIRPHQSATLTVDVTRLDTMRNHTATHLLNWALREVLGEHIQQAGSIVEPERLRFDFSHGKALSAEETAKIELLVNQRVLAEEPVSVSILPLKQAMAIPGVRAIFGEKYPDPVRVIGVGTVDPLAKADRTTAIEFCGGTHLSHTGQVGFFKIVGEEAVAKGVRRISAVTGRGAVKEVQAMDHALHSAVAAMKVPASQLATRIAAMQDEVKSLRKKLASGAGGGGNIEALVSAAQTINGVKLVVGELEVGSIEQLRSAVDQIRQKCGEKTATMVGWIDQDKVTLVASVSNEVIGSTALKAGDWVRQIAPIVGGGGGGKPQMAQAGGKDPAKLGQALQAAFEWAKAKLQ